MITKLQLPRMMKWAVPFTVSLILAGEVRAQSHDRPWTSGVSQEQQMRAKLLYEAGNRFLTNTQFAEAVTAYRGALQHWGHPGIHYNLALALISLNRPVEAYEATVEALRYGPDALRSDDYQRALDYQRLLREQIALVEIVCADPDADVSLDGRPLFTGPGRVTKVVLPGEHEIIASKPKHITSRKAFTAKAAGYARIELHLTANRILTSPREVSSAAHLSSPTEHQGTRARNYGRTTALVDGAVIGLFAIPILISDNEYAYAAFLLGCIIPGQITHSIHGNFAKGWLSSMNRIIVPLTGAQIAYAIGGKRDTWRTGGAVLGLAAALSLDWFVLSRDRVTARSEPNTAFWPFLSPTHDNWVAGFVTRF